MAELKYAIFIEPNGSLRTLVEGWKERCINEFGTAPYLEHPPHSTLLFTHLKNEIDACEILRAKCSSMSSLSIECENTIVFENDALAGGGHTLAFRLLASSSLLNLQLKLAESLEGQIDYGKEELAQVLNHGVFAESFKRFGFPFVGEHWIPHMSIASLKLERDHEMIREFEALSIKVQQNVESISLWSVQGENHQKISSFDLQTS